jgi:sn-glycerol 3-phosphate transport system permease protein
MSAPMPLLPGNQLLINYARALTEGAKNLGASAFTMMKNSFIMAMGIAVGKICVSLLAAFAIIFFSFPGRKFCFWAIFITLMLPVEVRIMPTYKVIADLHLMNSYLGLILPMIVSATAVFLFRQFFMSVPREIAEASQIDGASPMAFFGEILLPMTRTPIAAMFVIQFIYGWNQYLWPLLITTKESYYTLLIGINRILSSQDSVIEWQIVMATTLLAMIPPVIVVIVMQKQFVAGMTDTEK